MIDTELAYAAGIIDGEGSIGVGRKEGSAVAVGKRGSCKLSYHLLVQVSMKIPTRVPVWLHTTFGGHYGEYQQGKNAWGTGTIAKWSIHGTEAQESISGIRPYLIDKAERADMALAFPIASSSHKGVAETGMQQFVYEEMRRMNSKNKAGR